MRYSDISTAEAKKFFNERVQRDQRRPTPANLKEKYMPIFSKQGGAYQFDIWDQKGTKRKKNLKTGKWTIERRPYFLIVVNVNTKKAYQYPFATKTAANVLKALEKFWTAVPDCKAMVSDQDASFLAHQVVDAFIQRGIKLTTTTDNDHHSLGIINRLMRTLRDMRGGDRYFTEQDMARQIGFYNDNKHSATKEAPNDMDESKELEFISKKTEQASQAKGYDFTVGNYVRFLKPREKIGKVRSNYSVESYKIIQRNGRSFVIQAADGSTDTVPGWQLAIVLHKDLKRYPQGETLKNNKRGTIEEIESYDTKRGTYQVKYEGEKWHQNVRETNIREGAPTQLSLEEKRYWVQKHPDFKDIPERILRMVPKLSSSEEDHKLTFD
jgi:hypothetical protein